MHSHLHTPIKVLVMQSPMKIAPARLQQVFAPESKQALTLTTPVIAHGITQAEAYALTAMNSALAGHTHVIVETAPSANGPLIDNSPGPDFAKPLSPDAARRIRSATDADAILRFGITDYGLTPKSWRSSYITFEVVSTLAITALIASAGTSLAKGAAGAYLTQEAVEETAESYAGFWALDVVGRPVRIQAELIGLNPPGVLWRYDDTGFSDIKLARLYRKVDTTERDQQLAQATDSAVNDVVTDLASALDHLNHPVRHITPLVRVFR
ncbi:MAG: hypothetical protein GC149_13320 [Gammaproteobacteria bacterium]|nr:hypothetical protein [Gammaproteobacteria bacterium]